MFNGVLGFVMALAIIMVSTKLCGMFLRRLGLPQVLGYIIAGILIGPAITGNLGFALIGYESTPNIAEFVTLDEFLLDGTHDFTVLDVFSKIGVIMIMFSAGLETDLVELRRTGVAATLVAVSGVAIPLALGTVISLPFIFNGLINGFTDVVQGVFVGTILTATSVAITVSVLKELGKITTRIGTTLVSAAIIDDVIGIVVLSVVSSFGQTAAADASGFEWFKTQWWGTLIMVVAFFIVAIGVGIAVHHLFVWMERKWPHTRRLPILGLAIAFAYSVAAEEIFGVADITGAYIAGVVLSTVNRTAAYTDRKVEINSYMIFGPVFFAGIGISMTFSGMTGWLVLLSVLFVIVGLVGKVVGCGAVIRLRHGTWREAGIAGVGMMARGEVALIVTNKGIESGLIPADFMIMTVLLILFSSILTPALLKQFFRGHKEPLELAPDELAAPAQPRNEWVDDLPGGAEKAPEAQNTGAESADRRI